MSPELNPRKSRAHKGTDGGTNESFSNLNAEESIIKDLTSSIPDRQLEACRVLENCGERGLNLELLSNIAPAPLISLIVIGHESELRVHAHNALEKFLPELANGSRRYMQDFDNRIEYLRNCHEYRVSLSKSKNGDLPLSEHLTTAALLLCDMMRRVEMAPAGTDLSGHLKFAKIALENVFTSWQITQDSDTLSTYRSRLPLDVKLAQEQLDLLYSGGVVPNRIILAPHIAAKLKKVTPPRETSPATPVVDEPALELPSDEQPDSLVEKEQPSAPVVIEVEDPHIQRRNALMRMLHSSDSVEKAIAVVNELGEIGKDYCIQAIRQAAQGGLSSRGFYLSFPSAVQEKAFRQACAMAIANIERRAKESKGG